MQVWDLHTQEGRAQLPEGVIFDPVRGLVTGCADTTVEASIQSIYHIRRLKIESVQWAVERHQRQLRLGKPTTISEAELRQLDEYVEALCAFADELDPDGVVARGDALNGLAWPQLAEQLQVKVTRRDGGFF